MSNQSIKFTVTKADEYGYNVWIGTFDHTWYEDLEDLGDYFMYIANTDEQRDKFQAIIDLLDLGAEKVSRLLPQGRNK